ncbi:ABC transporter substrate-binding protein [Bifidobacterium aemilianum]|uniref:ABC transporter substrate-binding protein n=2 Tax=Bifidobacterium aemilianum TaxID=2493120 RepID=A0A366KBD4_9BIFI|nr:ABC transporter substrate-binding protein [Bifidobacterium aemilianum]
MRKVKSIAAIICCALSLTSLAACGSGKSEGPTTVEFMSMQAIGSPRLKAIQSLSKKFEQQNPNIKIKVITGTNTNENDIKVRLAGHNPPDMWSTHGWSRDRYGNFLEPLQNRPWAKQMKPLGDDIFKDSKGNFYALPVDIQISGIMFNKTVLDKVGLDYRTITSWEAFDDALAKVKEAGFTPLLASPKDGGIDGDIADYILPGVYSDKEKKDLKAGKFDSKVYEKMTSKVKKWVDAGYFNVDYTSASPDDLARAMASDSAAFYMRANSYGQLISSFNPNAKLGMMPVPAETSEKPYFSKGEDLAFGVSKTSKHKEDALKFLDFMAEPANMKELVDVSLNDSALKNVDSALGQFEDSFKYWVSDKRADTVPFFDRTYMPSGMYSNFSKSTDGIIAGQLSPSAAAEQVKTSFYGLYGQKKS